jgi:bifunctional non-homologous end joining protein LigD
MLFQPLQPMLLGERTEAFDDAGYFFEPKWDGVCVVLHKQGERIEAYTRHGKRITDALPEFQELAVAIRPHTAILDGEGIVLGKGRPVLDHFVWRSRLADPAKIRSAVRSHPATFVAFDVLLTEGREHLEEPLAVRKERLADAVMQGAGMMPTIFADGAGMTIWQSTKEQGWEGIVAKRKDSTYQLGVRSDDWLKIRHTQEIDTVILGYRMEPRFALVVGLQFRTVKNKPVGVVENGITVAEHQAFLEIAKGIRTQKEGRTQWVQPVLCCQVSYREMSEMHQMKEATFHGFLFEKRPEECRWEGSFLDSPSL